LRNRTERLSDNFDWGTLIVHYNDAHKLAMQRKAVGPKNAGQWWAVIRLDYVLSGDDSIRVSPAWPIIRDIPVRMHLADAVQLLRAAGYGNPLGAS